MQVIPHTGKAGLWKYWVKDVVDAGSLLFQKTAGQIHGRELYQQVASGKKNGKKKPNQTNQQPIPNTLTYNSPDHKIA